MWARVALGAALAVMAWLAYQTAGDAYERGDAYPPGSTLRADRSGAGVLYESLRRMPGWQVERSFRPAKEMPGEAATIVVPGLPAAVLTGLDRDVRRWTAAGARVVIGQRGARDGRKVRWLGMEIGGEAVEQPLGTGSVAVVPARWLENEAMTAEGGARRAIALLGGSRRVVFAEGVLGVREQGGVVRLLRRAGFGPAMLLALAAVGLYLWRASTALLPERADRAVREEPGGGREALARLFGRHIAAGQVLEVCLAEWRAAAPLLPRWQARRAEAAAAAPRGASPVEGYRNMQDVIKERPTL